MVFLQECEPQELDPDVSVSVIDLYLRGVGYVLKLQFSFLRSMVGKGRSRAVEKWRYDFDWPNLTNDFD